MRLIAFIFTLIISLLSFSVPKSEESPSIAQIKKKKLKSTQVSFDDILVQGQYQFNDEAVTTVEEDKVLDALLGIRTNFQDRINDSVEQY